MGKNWFRNQVRKQYKREKLDENYKFPMCHKCEECEFIKEKLTDVCKLLNRDVGQSVFGRNSPKCCPKRKGSGSNENNQG